MMKFLPDFLLNKVKIKVISVSLTWDPILTVCYQRDFQEAYRQQRSPEQKFRAKHKFKQNYHLTLTMIQKEVKVH